MGDYVDLFSPETDGAFASSDRTVSGFRTRQKNVAQRILSPSLPIEPRLFELSLSFQSNLGRVVYANSITLTPGTVTTKLSVETIEVHSLSSDSEQALRDGKMSARVLRLEKNPT